MPKRSQVIPGFTYGKWTVLRQSENKKGAAKAWVVRCECGTEDEVRGQYLRDGTTKMCRDCIAKFGRVTKNTLHEEEHQNIWTEIGGLKTEVTAINKHIGRE